MNQHKKTLNTFGGICIDSLPNVVLLWQLKSYQKNTNASESTIYGFLATWLFPFTHLHPSERWLLLLFVNISKMNGMLLNYQGTVCNEIRFPQTH